MILKKYVQARRELQMIISMINEMPPGGIYPRKKGKYIGYYHQWYVNGVKNEDYVRKKDVEELKNVFNQKKRLNNHKKQLKLAIQIYEKELKKRKLNPEEVFQNELQRIENLVNHRRQPKEQDSYGNKKHVTLKGEYVRSKSEMVIANQLALNQVPYAYEQPIILGGKKFVPDFTILDPVKTKFWEHAGFMQNADYRDEWEKKKRVYSENGIIEGDNLIVTYEHDGLDSIEIQNLIESHLLR